jgi:hypothetical protein
MATGDSGYQGGGAVLLNNFYNTLRQDEFRRQQQDAQEAQLRNKAREQTAKDLEDVTSKLTSKGLRNQAEIDIYTKMYEDVKGYKAMANSAQTPAERAKYTVLAKDTARKAMDFVDGAEEFKKGELTIANKFQTDPFSFGEDQKTLYKTNLNKPYTELGVRFDPTPYSTRLKPEEVEKKISTKIGGLLEAQGNLLARTKQFTIGNNEGNLFYQDLTIAPQEAAKEVLKTLNTDLGVREYYERLYPNAKPEEIAINIVNERVDKLGNISKRDTTGSFVENNKPQKDRDSETNFTPSIPVKKDFTSSDGKRKIISERFIAENMGTVALPQLESVYNITSGKNERLESLKDAVVTGIGYFPTNSTGTGKAGSSDKLVKGITLTRIQNIGGTSFAEEIFLRENQVPAKFRQSKAYKKLESTLDSGQTLPNPTPTTKTKPSAKPTVKVSKKADVL